ncbi:hypothetical protein F1C58_03275 [Glaciihabitans sp. INWT7]|uniref:hypothetical protein n=1 Tax=Glaciihabitans sp. INWT7 TaxID=2596912 RepID=UPI001626651D|nr:hypothetical protein [Glaciihabitans sp. INWT7]QNE46026.1 hypothetical protein F1C58_03275 [Glaciihabitans sp. INWT7]
MGGDHPIRAVAVSSTELSRLLAEPGFEAALRATWTGPGSLDDALHWRLRPSMPSPSGAADPAAELSELRARVYGRPIADEPLVEIADATGSVWVGESEARLLLLERRLERDAHTLDHAIARADRSAALVTEPEPERESEGEPEQEPERETGPAVLSVPSGPFARLLRRHPVPVFSAAALILTVAVVPVTATALAPEFTPSAGLLKVFNRPQGTLDIAPSVFTGGQPGARQKVRDTTRFLGAFYGVQVFAYRDSDDQVCLLSTAPSGHDVIACATVRAFALSGLSIAPVNYQVDSAAADATAGVTASSRLAFRWGPDADLSVSVVG